MQKSQQLLCTISHLQYQYNIIQSRLHTANNNINKQSISFISELDHSDIGFIYDTLQDRNILLTHTSPKNINYAIFREQLEKISGKKVNVIDAIQNLHRYALDINQNINNQSITFVALFGLNYLDYKPYLLKILKFSISNIILYCQQIQAQKIKQILNIQNIEDKFDQLQLDVPAPFQYIISDNLLQILQNFLRDQQKQIHKKDVVIFHEGSEQFKKKLFYITKTKGFSLSTVIVYQSQKQQKSKQKTYIYVAQNTTSLLVQNYNLLDVYLVLDFQYDNYTYFNYEKCCYFQIKDKLSYGEMCKRVNLNYGNIGEYVCGNRYNNKEYISAQEEKKYVDYGLYCLVMVQIGLMDQLCREAKQIVEIHYCLEALKNSQIITKDNKVSSIQIIELARQDVNPIIASSILTSISSQGQNILKTHLLILTHSIITSKNLRNVEKNEQPASVWRKTGYLESALGIIIRCLQFNTQKQDSTITLEDIASNFQIQIQLYEKIVKEYQRVNKLVKCQDLKWDKQLEEDDFNQLLQELITIFKPAVGTFSGSRRLGYLFKGYVKNLLAHRQCLMSYFNQKPNFIMVTKIILDSNTQKPLILDCNYIRDDILISTYGCLPTLSKQSFGQCEIQFHNITTAVFSHLSKFNGLQMDIFEDENLCSIQANSQLNIITIQCSKQKQNQINQKFTKVLKDIQQMFKKQTISFKQSHLLRVVLSSGGQISQFVVLDKNSSNQVMEMAILKNLAPQVGIQELKQLFDEFIQLKDLKMIQKQGKDQAIVYFYSADDFRKFYQYFSGCNYYDHCMIVQPYVQIPKFIHQQHYMLFQWNVWKSTGEALIEFQTTEQAKQTLTNFRFLAGQKAKIEQKANMIYAERLDTRVDQKDLLSWVSGLGIVTNIEVRRYAPKNINQVLSIKSIIQNSNPKQVIQCNPGQIIKGKNGHRSCQVKGLSKDKMNQLFFILNQVECMAGNGKLYVTPMFIYPISLPQPEEGYVNVYKDIINDFSKQLGRFIPLDTQLIREPLKWTLIIKTNLQQQMQIIKKTIQSRLVGVPLKINYKDTSLLFTQLAIKNFQKLEKKMPIKIIPDFLQKKINVLCKPSTLSMIQKQINTQIMESFTYPITLYQKAYIFIHKNIQEIAQEQILKGLKYKFQSITRTLNLQGNLFIIQRTRQKINKSLVKLKQNIQQTNIITDNTCGLCCQDFKNQFKLQGCGHVFCFDCLQDSINVVVQDITLYPIKCPQCVQKIWISDLKCLLQKKMWNQVLKISVNHFIFTHPGEYMFCFTAGCTFICNIKHKSNYSCPECKKAYCLSCRNLFHPGMNCHQARYGSDRLFSEYMSTVGGRVCANKQCKAPIQRISGCFKVQCSRCKKCMCFKCPANSMIPYNTAEQTYNHMNKIHGGCF